MILQEHTPKDKPSIPGRPYIIKSTTNSNIYITWQSSDKSTTKYELQTSYINENASQINKTTNWTLVYEDISNKWLLSNIRKANVTFRVRAKNNFGISDWSNSDIIDLANEFINQPQG